MLLRAVAGKLFANAGKILTRNIRPIHPLTHHGETEEDFDTRYVFYFTNSIRNKM